MLILTRKPGESIVIGDDIFCTVLGYWNDEVRLAFDAPRSMPVHCEEIQRRLACEQANRYERYDLLMPQESVVDRLISRFKTAAA